MIKEIECKRLLVGSLFSFIVTGYVFSFVPFALLMGVFSIFGYGTITINDETVTGVKGFLVSIPLGLVLALVFSCATWIFFVLGWWLSSKVRTPKLAFLTSDSDIPTQSLEA